MERKWSSGPVAASLMSVEHRRDGVHLPRIGRTPPLSSSPLARASTDEWLVCQPLQARRAPCSLSHSTPRPWRAKCTGQSLLRAVQREWLSGGETSERWQRGPRASARHGTSAGTLRGVRTCLSAGRSEWERPPSLQNLLSEGALQQACPVAPRVTLASEFRFRSYRLLSIRELP